MQLQIGLEELLNTYQGLQEVEKEFGVDDSRNEDLMTKLLGPNWKELQPQLVAVATELENLQRKKNALLVKEENLRGLPNGVKQQEMLAISVERANIALEEKTALLTQMSLRTQFAGEAERRIHEQNMQQTKDEIRLLEAKLETAKRNNNQAAQLADTAMQSLEDGLARAIDSIVQGTATIKDAFRSMAVAVLQALSQMIAKMIAVKIMQTLIGMSAAPTAPINYSESGAALVTPGGQGGAGPGGKFFRYGGIAEPPSGYSTGGIAKGPQAGYPATLHGTEAVVPLPNGKSIPVHMEGAAGQMNNVTVNVAMDNTGQASTSTQGDTGGMDIGKAIANAVQKELQNQKRAGGILSPYGVA